MTAIAWRRPRFLALALLVLAELLFLSAASWQFSRGSTKKERDAVFAASLQAPSAALYGGPTDPDYRLVEVAGDLRSDRVYLHDNRVHEGRFGVAVYAPLITAQGALLVEYGHIAADPSRQVAAVIPDLPAPPYRGVLVPAPARGLVSDPDSNPTSWPRLRLNIDPVRIGDELDLPLAPRVLRLLPEPGSPFARDLKLPGLAAEKHFGYAAQWASFALAALLLFAYLHRPGPRP